MDEDDENDDDDNDQNRDHDDYDGKNKGWWCGSSKGGEIMILTHCTLFYFQLSHVSEGTHICPRYEYKAFSFFFCFAIRAS